MTTKILTIKKLDGKIQLEFQDAKIDVSEIEERDLIKEYVIEDEREEGIENVRCCCEWGTSHPMAFALGEKICNHIELYLKLPQLFE